MQWDTSSIPGPGRFHMPGSNSACAPWPLKPTYPGASAQQEKPLQREASAQLETSPNSQNPSAAVKTRRSQK